MSTAELRSINSGPIRRALENLQQQIGGTSSYVTKGVYAGTATALPTTPKAGDLWIIGTPVPTLAPKRTGGSNAVAGDGMVWSGTAWINTGPTQGPPGQQGPMGLPGAQGPAGIDGPVGPAGPDEVWIGVAAPTAPSQELWIDTDEDPPAGGTDEVWIGASAPAGATLELWVDVDEDPTGGGSEEVWIGPTAPVGAYDLWVDTSA